MQLPTLGLPTLDLGIPGRPRLPSRLFPPLPPFPLPSLLPVPRRPHPKLAMGSGERCKLPQWVWGKAPADKRFGAYI